MEQSLQTCSRCGGRFPGPGVERQGQIYCCDKCAQGPRRMLPRMMLRLLPIIVLLVGSGTLIGRYLSSHAHGGVRDEG